MRKASNIILIAILSISGGFFGQYLNNQFLSKNINYSSEPYVDEDKYLASMVSKSASNQIDLTMASEQTVKSVVHIQTHFVREKVIMDPFLKLFYGEESYKTQKQHGQASGSGVVISDDGYIVTNNHVVQDAKEISVVLNNKKYIGEIIGTDPSTDLALIKIEGKGLTYSEFGDSDELKLGEWVLAVGNPLNLQSTVTAGIVSAKNRNIDLLTTAYNPDKNVFPVESFIQTDAAVNSGNSGGALVNASGKLIGINTAIASGTGYYTGYSFAVPSNIVKKVTFDLMTYGKVQRVMLGINLLKNNADVSNQYQLSTDQGIVITNVLSEGNAAKSGLKELDVITEIDGVMVSSVAKIQELIAMKNPGDSIRVKVKKGNSEEEYKIILDM